MKKAKCDCHPDNAGELIGLKFNMPNVTGIMENKTSRFRHIIIIRTIDNMAITELLGFALLTCACAKYYSHAFWHSGPAA